MIVTVYIHAYVISYHAVDFPKNYHDILNHAYAFACRNACAWFDLQVENPK